MKIKKLSQFFLGLLIMSSLLVASGLVYLKIHLDHSPTIVSKKPQLIQKVFNSTERKYITYQKEERFYFVKDYFQFLILQDLSLNHRELLTQGVNFFYDDLQNPRSAQVLIGNNPEDVWNYSII